MKQNVMLVGGRSKARSLSQSLISKGYRVTAVNSSYNDRNDFGPSGNFYCSDRHLFDLYKNKIMEIKKTGIPKRKIHQNHSEPNHTHLIPIGIPKNYFRNI